MVPFPPPTDCGVDGDRTAAGADLAAVQRILRHSDPKLTTEVYAHLAPEYLRAEVDRLSFGAAVLETVPAASLDSAVGLQRDGTPPLQKHSPPAPHWRDVVYLPFFSGFCPGFCPGLSRARYDSPSMTRS
jgi:hypothetical protein